MTTGDKIIENEFAKKKKRDQPWYPKCWASVQAAYSGG